MKPTDILVGFVAGIVTALAGTYIFLEFVSGVGIKSLTSLRQFGLLGQVLTLGSILNLVVFFLMIQQKKDLMARGVIIATATLAIITIML
jgi:hypothetical protein